ncbi:MAG: FG-GAP-like repeat-containing protein [bacterium]|nr:FG-GAP-like repeat-containing protein [bacterium]
MKSFSLKTTLLVLLFLVPSVSEAAYGDVTTWLGQVYDGDGETGLEAYFDFQEDITVDVEGNFFIADTHNNVIRKINTEGVVSTVAGSGRYGLVNGAANAAEFALPHGVAVADGVVFVADTENDVVRKIDQYGSVSTLVGTGLNSPEGVEVYGGIVYIADTGNNAVKSVSINGGDVQTLSSNLNAPKKLAANDDGNFLFVADSGSHKVKRITISNGQVVDIAGSGENEYVEGVGTAAAFQNIWGVEYHDGDLYVTDGDGFDDKLRKIDLETNATMLLARDQAMAALNFPSGLTIHDGNLYVSNMGIGTIRRFLIADPDDNQDFAGAERFGNRNGDSEVLLGRPWDLLLSPDRQYIYLAENNKIRRIRYADKSTSHVIGNSVDNYVEGNQAKARFSNITSLAINADGAALYLTDRWNNRVRRVDLTTMSSSLVAGGGLINTTGSDDNGYREGFGEDARFRHPGGLAIAPNGEYLYVADTGNNRIRRVVVATGQTALVAGSGQAGFLDGQGDNASFDRPFGMTIDQNGEYLYIADTNNHAIRRIRLSDNMVTTIAGTGSAGYRDAIGRDAVFSLPEYVELDTAGNLYVSEVGSHRIRVIEPGTFVTKLVTSSGVIGYVNGVRTVSRFHDQKGMLVDRLLNQMIVADANNDVLRRVDITGTAPYTESAPAILGTDPDRVSLSWDNGSGLRVKILGSDFRHGASTKFGALDSPATYVVSDSELVVELPISQMRPGWYDVQVTNSDGQYAHSPSSFGIMDGSGEVPSTVFETDLPGSFYAYSSSLRGGYYISSGNVLGDLKEEVITGTGNGFGPQVRVFDGEGNIQSQFFAYFSFLRSGVRVASCDLNGDGRDEIVTAPGPGGRPHIRIFDYLGNPTINNGFFALDGLFLGGANVACGDVDGDGLGEILVAAGPGGGPHVTIHESDGTMIGNFMAYAPTFRGGINLDSIDLNGDGKSEIITGPERGGPHVQIFTGWGHRITPGTFAFDPSFGGGVVVAGGDVDGDGRDEILATPGPRADSVLKIYENFGNTFAGSFDLFSRGHTGAARIAAGDIDGNGVDEIVAIPNSDGSPFVVMYRSSGARLE